MPDAETNSITRSTPVGQSVKQKVEVLLALRSELDIRAQECLGENERRMNEQSDCMMTSVFVQEELPCQMEPRKKLADIAPLVWFPAALKTRMSAFRGHSKSPSWIPYLSVWKAEGG